MRLALVFRHCLLPLMSLLSLVLAGLGIKTTGFTPVLGAAQPDERAIQLLVATSVGTPVGAGDYLFWVDNREEQTGIYGYNLTTHQEFLVRPLDVPTDAYELATDGHTLAWIDRTVPDPPYMRIQGYAIEERREYTLVQPVTHGVFSGLNLVDDILYYADAREGHEGIYQYDLATHTEAQLHTSGWEPVVADGMMVWRESTWMGSHQPARVRLLLMHLSHPQDITTLAVEPIMLFSGYDISGDTVVWAPYPSPSTETKNVFLFQVSTGITTPLQSGTGFAPIISENLVFWTECRGTSYDEPLVWLIRMHDRATGRYTTLAKANGELRPVAFLDTHNVLAVSTWFSLYLITLEKQAAEPTPPAPPARCFAETGSCIDGRIREFWGQSRTPLGRRMVPALLSVPDRRETVR